MSLPIFLPLSLLTFLPNDVLYMDCPMQGPQALTRTMPPNSKVLHNPTSPNNLIIYLLYIPPIHITSEFSSPFHPPKSRPVPIYSPSKSPHSFTSKLSRIFLAIFSPSFISFVASPSVAGFSYSPA